MILQIITFLKKIFIMNKLPSMLANHLFHSPQIMETTLHCTRVCNLGICAPKKRIFNLLIEVETVHFQDLFGAKL